MRYLEKFARNKRGKEKSEVLTARLPKSLYENFKVYCDELGLSISEGVYLLVEHEMRGNEGTERVVNNELATTIEREPTTQNTQSKSTKRSHSNTKDSKVNINKSTSSFSTKQWQVEGEIPCPICQEWFSSSNFSKHAKGVHESTRIEIFSNEENIDMANTLYFGRTGKEVKN